MSLAWVLGWYFEAEEEAEALTARGLSGVPGCGFDRGFVAVDAVSTTIGFRGVPGSVSGRGGRGRGCRSPLWRLVRGRG